MMHKRLTRTGKQAVAFAAFWCAISLLVALIFAYPKLLMFAVLGGCAVVLARTSWELVGNLIND
jgi:hypothetical protein